jgi:predicted amidohydrolase YtcJ
MADADVVITGTVPPEQIADLDVRATYLAGRQVYSQ